MISAIIKISYEALMANKLRSGLTLLGVIIGVTSVMTIISALESVRANIEADLASLGPATFIVQKWGMATTEEEWLEIMKRKRIKPDAVELIDEGCELCEKLSPVSYNNASVKYSDRSIRRVSIRGSYYNLVDIIDVSVAQGRFHSYEDDLHRRNVAFIGDQVKERLFPNIDPIGKTIRIGGRKYTVIGVGEKTGSTFGDNPDNYVRIPFSTMRKQFGEPGDDLNLAVKAASVERLDDAMDEVRLILRAKRHVPFDKPDDFSMLTADSILEFLNQITQMLRYSLIGISSIALVVGGIVVMNIMMVSVTERTREIGIRKSIGAKQKHIMLQFLFEALMTTFTGGVIGILLGFLAAKLLVGLMDMDIAPTAFAITAGLLISSGTGIIFGIFPAMKAARLDPIKALSYE